MFNLFSKAKREKEPQAFNIQGYGKEAKDQLTELCLEYLKPHWYESDYVPGLTLYLFEHKDASQISLMTNNAEFRNELLHACKDKSVNVDDNFKWEVKVEQPQSAEAKEVRKNIYLLIEKQAPVKEESEIPPVLAVKARITALKGELVKKTYTLNSKMTKTFNIGRGENPQLANGMFHKNHIAVKEDERRNISREHACIFYDHQKGFYLKAYIGGTKLKDNETLLFRDGKVKKDFINTNDKEQLQHGDQIKLGVKSKDSVILLFEEIE